MDLVYNREKCNRSMGTKANILNDLLAFYFVDFFYI